MKLTLDFKRPYERSVHLTGERGSKEFLQSGTTDSLAVIPKSIEITYFWRDSYADWKAVATGPCPPGMWQKTGTIGVGSYWENLPKWFTEALEEHAPPEWLAVWVAQGRKGLDNGSPLWFGEEEDDE